MSADKQSSQASDWGRVTEDGTVYVRTSDGERSVGQYPEGTPEEALKFFTDRYDALAFEVQLLEQRIGAGRLSPEEATSTVKGLREQVVGANAVGDLVGLTARLDALGPLIGLQRSKRREERARRLEEAGRAPHVSHRGDALVDVGRLVHECRLVHAHAVCPATSRMSCCHSCSDRTPMSPPRIASMPWTAAPSPCTVVMHGMFAITAAVRIS